MKFPAAILLLLFALTPVQAQQGMSKALVVSSCGAGALPSGALNQLMMNPQGQLCMTGVASLGPPVISVAPVASGTASVGSTLSCTTGTWTLSPSSYAYTWLRGGSTISGAASATYVLVSADWGTAVGCSVIATNGSGNSAPAASNTIAITGCPQAVTYLARATGETTHAADLTTLICGLTADGVITGNLSGARGCGTKLDVFDLLAQQTAADALLNLCGTSYSLVNAGALPFTPYRGFTGNGTWMDMNFNATTAVSPNITQNSGIAGVWIVNSRTTLLDNWDMGAASANAYGVIPLTSTGQLQGAVNDSTYPKTTVGMANAQGWSAFDRSSSASVIIYKNGSAVQTIAAPSTGLVAVNVFLGALNTSGGLSNPSTDQLGAAVIGASLGASLNLALYTRLRTYMTAVGVP